VVPVEFVAINKRRMRWMTCPATMASCWPTFWQAQALMQGTAGTPAPPRFSRQPAPAPCRWSGSRLPAQRADCAEHRVFVSGAIQVSPALTRGVEPGKVLASDIEPSPAKWQYSAGRLDRLPLQRLR
jgi:hypothetical protein